MRLRFFTSFFLTLIFFSGEAQAVCLNLTLDNLPSVVTFRGGSGEYSVYDGAEYMQSVNFQVRGEAAGGICDYFVTLSAGQSGTFSQRTLSEAMNTLNYNAYVTADKSSILKDVPIATNSEVVQGSFPLIPGLNQTNEHSFYWTINPAQIVPASALRYADTGLTVSLYSGLPLLTPTLITSKTITFQARAESSVDLSLVETGEPFDINHTSERVDFGTLESGEDRAFDLIVRSNDGYVVTMESLNKEALVHESAPTVPDRIPYNVLINGGSVGLASGAPVQILSGTDTTPVTGTAFPIEFVVGPLSGQEAAGSYSDVIDVEVTAN